MNFLSITQPAKDLDVGFARLTHWLIDHAAEQISKRGSLYPTH